MKFKLIACINTNLALGNDGKLLYHIPNDLKNFSRMTRNNVIIMGRKTYESLPNSLPLPNRINIIITNNSEYSTDSSLENIHIVHSLEEAKELCEAFYSDLECYIIGGSTLYQEALDKELIDTMYITTVNDSLEGDTFFPSILFDECWKIFYQSYTQRCRQENLTYYFTIYKKS